MNRECSLSRHGQRKYLARILAQVTSHYDFDVAVCDNVIVLTRGRYLAIVLPFLFYSPSVFLFQALYLTLGVISFCV